MSKGEISALLGRPLTPIEDTNFDQYLEIAEQNLLELICTPIETSLAETRVFDTRKGYRTAFTDVFTAITEVKLDNQVVDPENYTVMQWSSRRGTWFNSIVFKTPIRKDADLEVTGDWGFGESLPLDLQTVLAGLFALVSKKPKQDGSIQSKQVEDFRITFNTNVNLDDEFYRAYSKTIAKYSLCDVGQVDSGAVRCGC